MSHSQELDELHEYLSPLPPGSVCDIDGLLARLKPAWHDLEGSESNSMAAYKLDRIEDPDWAPPILSFIVERHGATALGSTRAELQHWRVNLDTDEAFASPGGRRQLTPMAPPLKVGPLVERLVDLVESSSDDDWLSWSPDRSIVKVRVGQIIPAEGPKETTQGRRRRFRSAHKTKLESLGWTEVSANRYRRTGASALRDDGP